MSDAEDTADRSRDILTSAKELATLREADADAGPTPRLLEALLAIRTQHGETVNPADLLAALRGRPGWDWLKTTRRLAALLNPLGIARRQFWNGGQRRWCYMLDGEQLADLQERYGIAGDGVEVAAQARAEGSPAADESPGADAEPAVPMRETGAIR